MSWKRPEPVILSPATPQISAAKFKAAHYPTLIIYQNEFMHWNGSAYVGLEAATIESAVSKFMGAAKVAGFETVKSEEGGEDVEVKKFFPFNPKQSHINEVFRAVKSSCHVPIGTMDPPAWLPGAPKWCTDLDPKKVISFQNGILDIEMRLLYPATPYLFTRTALDINYEPDAPVPEIWLEFLQQVTNNRQELVDLIQEVIGYLITPDTSLHAIFFLWGRTRSGKGTILQVITGLVGKRNTRFPSIETLAGRFGLHNLIDASVAQITDANVMDRRVLGLAASRMNGISGCDGVTVERKGIGDWNGSIPVRFIMAANALPNFGVNTMAMATRLKIIPFDVTFEGREDRFLIDKLIAVLPGILNWALAGRDRLTERGDFVEPEVSKAAKKRLVHLSDPIHGFCADHCVLKVGAGVDKSLLYKLYVAYCEAAHARPLSETQFVEGLIAIHGSVKTSRRPSEGPQVQCLRNIRLNEATALRVYKVERDNDELGIGEPLLSVQRDAKGWPIPRPDGGDFGVGA
jgi:putative DNA primase/helicase